MRKNAREENKSLRESAPAEVGDLELAVEAEEQILGLDVPVDDVLLVAVIERAGHVEDVLGRFRLGEAELDGELLIKFSARRELEDEVDALLVPEVAVHAQNVPVHEVRLDLDFTPELVLDAVLLELRLAQHLQGHDVLVLARARQVDAAELAVAQGPAHLEVVELHRATPRRRPRQQPRPIASHGRRGLRHGLGLLLGERLQGLRPRHRHAQRAPELARRRHLTTRKKFERLYIQKTHRFALGEAPRRRRRVRHRLLVCGL